MRKYIILFLMGIMGFVSLKAQSFSPFFQPLTWEQASFVAARDNKLVLVEVGPVEKSLGGKLEKTPGRCWITCFGM